MSRQKKSQDRRHAPVVDAPRITEAHKEFPHIPLATLQKLDALFSFESARATGRQLRTLWKRALFPTGTGFTAEELDELSPVYDLMEVLADAAPSQDDMLTELLN